MVELFPDIPERVRKQAEFIVDMALRQNSPLTAIKIVREYAESCVDEEERNFVDFYFNLRMERILNES